MSYSTTPPLHHSTPPLARVVGRSSLSGGKHCDTIPGSAIISYANVIFTASPLPRMQHNTPPTATSPSTPATPTTLSHTTSTPPPSNQIPPTRSTLPAAFYHTRKSSIAFLLSLTPPAPPPDLSAQLAEQATRGRVTVRHWVQGDVVDMDSAAFPEWLDVDDGSSGGRPLRVVLGRLPGYQTAQLDVGSYILCIGVVRERKTEVGVAMLAHVCKVMTEVRAVRRPLWQFELEDMHKLDNSRERQWQTAVGIGNMN